MNKTAILEFEEVRKEYAIEDARGIPMSVREWYDKALEQMRQRIRKTRNSAGGKKLGELLLEQGALDQEKLQQALTEQQQRGTGELLGEVLEALGLVNEETLLSALRMQIGKNSKIRRDV